MTKPTKNDAREKLQRFLKEGDPDDVASVLVHTLMHRADVAAQTQAQLKAENKKAGKKKKD